MSSLIIKLIIYTVITSASFTGCTTEQNKQDNENGSPGTEQQGLAYTNKPNVDKPGSPLYTNHTRGAAHVMKTSKGIYYSYASDDTTNWKIHKSEDGIHWKLQPRSAFPQGTWGKSHFWVPKVIEYKDKFYMYYVARENPEVALATIGLAIADKPEGPFKDVGYQLLKGTKLEGFHVIDPNPLIDSKTGKHYLYVSKGAHYQYYHEYFKEEVTHSIIHGMELSEDMMKVVSEPVELIRPSQEWEYKSAGGKNKTLWNEAPEVFERNGTYYMMYSANNFTTQHYALGYATAKHPLGPWTKYEHNPVVSSTNDVKKTGHNTVVPSVDDTEFFTSYTTLDFGRYTSRIGFREDGSMYVNGPIKSYQEMPSGSTNYKNYAKDAKITASSTKAGYRLQAINDGEIGIQDRFEKYEWCSDSEKAGAWVQLSWDKPQNIETILIYDSAVRFRMLNAGHVIFNNNPKEKAEVKFPNVAGDPAVIHFEAGKDISSIKFVVDSMFITSDSTAGLSEIVVLGKKK